MAGLIIAALLAFPLSLLPAPFRNVLPFIGVLLFSYFGVAVFIMRQNDIFSVLRVNLPGRSQSSSGSSAEESAAAREAGRTILLDTSVVIDGRIADVAQTGFLSGTLLIPRRPAETDIADSPDSPRSKGAGVEWKCSPAPEGHNRLRISDTVEGAK
jgi:uncharacterized protein YacL